MNMLSSLFDSSLVTADPINGKNSTGNLTTPFFQPYLEKTEYLHHHIKEGLDYLQVPIEKYVHFLWESLRVSNKKKCFCNTPHQNMFKGCFCSIQINFCHSMFPLSVFPVFKLTATLSKDMKANYLLCTPNNLHITTG